MALTLKLRFSGLCAFTPKDSGLTVILPDARQHSHGAGVEPHHGLLFVARKYLAAGSRMRSFAFNSEIFSPRAGGELFDAFLLGNESLSLSPVTARAIDPIGPEPSGCPTGNPPFGWEWISRMAAVDPSHTLKAGADQPGGKTLATVKLTAAIQTATVKPKVSAFALNYDEDRILKWQFQSALGANPKGWERAIPEEIEFPIPFNRAPLVVSSSAGDIELTPIGELVEIWIVNMPLLDVLTKRTVNPRPEDHHFSAFYDLSRSAVNAGHILWPVLPQDEDATTCALVSTGGISHPRCPGTYIEP